MIFVSDSRDVFFNTWSLKKKRTMKSPKIFSGRKYVSNHCCVSYSTSKERGPCLEDQLVSGVGLFPFQMAGPRCLINGGYYLLTKWDDPSKMVVRPSYLHMYICHDRSLRLLYMYLLIHYRSSKFVEKLHFCICVHNKYDLIGLWVQKCYPGVWVFTDFNVSIFVLFKKRMFFVGKTSLMFQSRWSPWFFIPTYKPCMD